MIIPVKIVKRTYYVDIKTDKLIKKRLKEARRNYEEGRWIKLKPRGHEKVVPKLSEGWVIDILAEKYIKDNEQN